MLLNDMTYTHHFIPKFGIYLINLKLLVFSTMFDKIHNSTVLFKKSLKKEMHLIFESQS